MFDAQYWALIKNNSGKNVPEKVRLRPFLMVGWHDGTYLAARGKRVHERDFNSTYIGTTV